MIRIAQLGAGRMGALHARNAARHPALELVAIADPRTDAARALTDETGARVGDFEAILADETIQGVIVASSTDQHLAHTLSALRAGKAVFCEKPLDLSLATLTAHGDELAAPGARLFVAFNRRFDRHFRALKARLDSGAIGALESLHLISHDPAAPPPGFVPTSGGLFRDFTIHDLDTARWLLGEEPCEVFAWAACLVDPAIGAAGDVDTARTVLRTPSGRLCVISNTRRSGYGYDQRVEAYGSEGAAFVDNVATAAVSVLGPDGAQGSPFPYAFMDRYAAAYAAEMDHFVQVIGGAPPSTGYDASVRSLALAEAAARSAQANAPVTL
jgi:myo-inositol 2-dehydrogenase/D-chiro-inositol 1-dehydrogenase